MSRRRVSEIDRWIAKYPADQKQSAVMSCVAYCARTKLVTFNPELMDAVAEYLDMPRILQFMKLQHFIQCMSKKPVGNMLLMYVPIFPACYVA